MEALQLKNYFLGNLSSPEVEEIELEIISNPEIEDQIHQAEEDLIEDYLENSLTADELKKFQNNYLITNERHLKVKLIKELKNISQKTQNFVIKDDHSNFLDRLKAKFGLQWIPITLGFGILLLISFVWFWGGINNQNQFDREIIALNSQDLSNLENFRNFKIINLASGNSRSGENFNRTSENDLSEGVLLRLALPNSTSSVQNYTIKILKNGQVLTTLTQPSLQGQEVRLILPKALLNKGEYHVRLEKGNEKYNYLFTIQ